MEKIRTAEPITVCLQTLNIPSSSYYYFIHHPPLKEISTQKRYQGLRKKIEKIIRKHPGYGYRRIQDELSKQGISINHKPLKKLLQIWHLQRFRRITVTGFKDNPAIESCIGHFKEEYKDQIEQARNLTEAKKIITRCIRDWNKNRIHSALKGRSPDEFIHTFYILKKS